MHLDSQIRPWAQNKRKEMAKLMDDSYTEINKCVEKTDFPFFLLPKLAAMGTVGTTIKDFNGPGMTILETAAILFEIAKRDVSVATFYNVHT
jgi:alkylation response protein AidB-like acyl-CoA dehydrogenase